MNSRHDQRRARLTRKAAEINFRRCSRLRGSPSAAGPHRSQSRLIVIGSRGSVDAITNCRRSISASEHEDQDAQHDDEPRDEDGCQPSPDRQSDSDIQRSCRPGACIAARAPLVQLEVDGGPCLTAMRAGGSIRIDNTLTGERWPRWWASVAAFGIRSSISVSLTSGDPAPWARSSSTPIRSALRLRRHCRGQRLACHAAIRRPEESQAGQRDSTAEPSPVRRKAS